MECRLSVPGDGRRYAANLGDSSLSVFQQRIPMTPEDIVHYMARDFSMYLGEGDDLGRQLVGDGRDADTFPPGNGASSREPVVRAEALGPSVSLPAIGRLTSR